MVRVAPMRGDADDSRWLAGLNDPDGGRVALIAPPATPSLGSLLQSLLLALGKDHEDNPHQLAGARVEDLARAWLSAMRVDRLIVGHADWLPQRVLRDLVGFAARSGVELACVVHPGQTHLLDAWSPEVESTARFIEREAGDRERVRAVAADPERSQADPIGPAAPRALRPAGADGPLDPVGLTAYGQLEAAIRRGGRGTPELVRATAEVLRQQEPHEVAAAARGCALALSEAGHELRPGTGVPGAGDVLEGAGDVPWRALRAGLDPAPAAMVAAVSVGLLAADVRDLRVADVAEDGSSVAGPDGPLAVPSGARAYLRAQRALRGLEQAAPGSPLFARRGRPLTPKAVADAAWGALAQVGVALDARELARRRTPSERWLAQRGLHVRPSPGRGGPLRRTPTCRAHRVPRDLDVDGSVLSHSQNICWISGRHADVASHMRPARNGFELTVTRDCELGQVMDVRQHGRPHGELIALSAGDGRIWFQRTGSARPRSLEAIVATLERDYPDALGGVARGP